MLLQLRSCGRFDHEIPKHGQAVSRPPLRSSAPVFVCVCVCVRVCVHVCDFEECMIQGGGRTARTKSSHELP